MGHKRTIRPNARKLSSLFQTRHEMDWKTFAKKVKSCQRGFMGEPEEMTIRAGRDEFYEFPSTCICRKPYRANCQNSNNTDMLHRPVAVEPESNRENDEGKVSLGRPDKNSTGEEHASSDEDTDQQEFLPD